MKHKAILDKIVGLSAKIDFTGAVCHRGCVHETITIRPTISKTELKKRCGGNLNKWINGLIERAVGERA